jgi:hypothetical protein
MSAWISDHHHIPLEPPLAGAWQAWRRRDELDDRLIAGADPAGTPALARRARRLTAVACRDSLACELDAVVAAAHTRCGSRALDLRVPEVRAAEPALAALAARLRGSDPCRPGGVALCRRLLRDPRSPLYEPAPNDELWRAARAALRALDSR